ncbi:hypothetical protein pb186bvf_011709 [Paramecium bursaria]
MQSCQLCKMQAINPIMLICSHSLCLRCGENIQLQEHTSQIQNKYRIQCPKCRRLTHTYEIRNLLIESNELNLITDSSEMDREILDESQLCHNKQDLLARRKSNIQERLTPTQIKPTETHNGSLNTLNSSFNKPKIGSDRVSPALKKIEEINIIKKDPKHNNSNNLKTNEYLKPNNTPNATPQGTPLSQEFNLNFQQSDKPKQVVQVKSYSIQQKQLFEPKFEKHIQEKPQEKTPSQKPYDEQMKENQFQKDLVEEARHKRSNTGLPNQADASQQIIKQYFKMVQKNLQKLENDMLQQVQKVDANSLYARLKALSLKINDQDGELVQSIKVVQKLQSEIQGLSTPNYHRKTSSHSSNRYNHSKTHEKTQEKTQEKQQEKTFEKTFEKTYEKISDNSTSSVSYKKFL